MHGSGRTKAGCGGDTAAESQGTCFYRKLMKYWPKRNSTNSREHLPALLHEHIGRGIRGVYFRMLLSLLRGLGRNEHCLALQRQPFAAEFSHTADETRRPFQSDAGSRPSAA